MTDSWAANMVQSWTEIWCNFVNQWWLRAGPQRHQIWQKVGLTGWHCTRRQRWLRSGHPRFHQDGQQYGKELGINNGLEQGITECIKLGI
eukprot:14446915-Ditylum_brightwellii.AAC.1